MVVSGKALAGAYHPFGLLAAKRTTMCRFSFFETYRFLGDIASPFFPFFRPPPQFPGDDYLRDLQKSQIPILHALLVVFDDVEVLGRVTT